MVLFKYESQALLTIAYRDWVKLVRDRTRIFATFVFPFMFIAILGKSFDANLSDTIGYNYLTFVFIGVLGQTLFQSTASGIISLIEDRETDFSQEIFVTPVSRYTIILGKIVGETCVSLTQIIGIIGLGFLIGVRLHVSEMVAMAPAMLLISLLGGAFGVFVMSYLSTQRLANQVFPFLLFPQFFLAGVFNPIKGNPFPYQVLTHLAPMTYAVDLLRSIFYHNRPEGALTILHSTSINTTAVIGFSLIFFILGTKRFISRERNR